MRKEAEKVVASPTLYDKVPVHPFPDVRACFVEDAHSARYETHCAEVQTEQAQQAQQRVASAHEGGNIAGTPGGSDKGSVDMMPKEEISGVSDEL